MLIYTLTHAHKYTFVGYYTIIQKIYHKNCTKISLVQLVDLAQSQDG